MVFPSILNRPIMSESPNFRGFIQPRKISRKTGTTVDVEQPLGFRCSVPGPSNNICVCFLDIVFGGKRKAFSLTLLLYRIYQVYIYILPCMGLCVIVDIFRIYIVFNLLLGLHR